METLKATIINKIRQPSTWKGVLLIVCVVIAHYVDPEVLKQHLNKAVIIYAAIAIFWQKN